MSTLVSRSLSVNHDNCQTYGTYSGNVGWSSSGIISGKTSGLAYYILNSAAKDILYPNAAAHPEKADLSGGVNRDWYLIGRPTAYASIQFGGADIISGSSNSETTVTFSRSDVTDANVVGSVKDTVIRGTVHGSNTTYSVRLISMTITLYFTRYDFAANGSTGVTASVDRPTGYDGDTITFTASVQSGYTFEGWYNGSSKVSSSLTYQHTVSGADVNLTARATAITKTVTTKYNGTTIVTETLTPPVSVKYNDTQITSVHSGETKTLQCNGKLMHGNVTVGGKTLTCDGKVMSGDIVVSVS